MYTLLSVGGAGRQVWSATARQGGAVTTTATESPTATGGLAWFKAVPSNIKTSEEFAISVRKGSRGHSKSEAVLRSQ